MLYYLSETYCVHEYPILIQKKKWNEIIHCQKKKKKGKYYILLPIINIKNK